MTPFPTPEADAPACLDHLLGDGPIMVLTPHPDDAAFGCGALLSHAFARSGAHVVCMGEGPHAGRAGGAPRIGEMELALVHLRGGAGDITALRRPAGWAEQRDTFPMLATHVGTIARAMGVRRIFSTARTSDDAEHRATAEIAERAAEMYGLELWHYPVWARWTDDALSSGAAPGCLQRLPIGAAAPAKARAIAAFRGQGTRAAPALGDAADLPTDERDQFLVGDEIYMRADRAPSLGGAAPDRTRAATVGPADTP
ncbi:GlcNAc-PI de-N-acetylase [Roseivivax jejudonensis]|uniref:GlcNAc-PI de-N-acetylase n=1 Tax=Roseivivax jejudonensis TaxID=1529041 RepID=A0A1X6Y6X3_9RHOB|nr:PIG-L family deacetylase [Roseivivax jejudonensis]SLN12479.1 GlcNAc-PI de-N-acetylase [Roseivivax jejudonensis]